MLELPLNYINQCNSIVMRLNTTTIYQCLLCHYENLYIYLEFLNYTAFYSIFTSIFEWLLLFHYSQIYHLIITKVTLRCENSYVWIINSFTLTLWNNIRLHRISLYTFVMIEATTTSDDYYPFIKNKIHLPFIIFYPIIMISVHLL